MLWSLLVLSTGTVHLSKKKTVSSVYHLPASLYIYCVSVHASIYPSSMQLQEALSVWSTCRHGWGSEKQGLRAGGLQGLPWTSTDHLPCTRSWWPGTALTSTLSLSWLGPVVLHVHIPDVTLTRRPGRFLIPGDPGPERLPTCLGWGGSVERKPEVPVWGSSLGAAAVGNTHGKTRDPPRRARLGWQSRTHSQPPGLL